MAFREMDLTGLCTECRESTDQACVRCRAPFCGAHLPADAKRCAPCEASYAERISAIESHTTIRRFYGWNILKSSSVLARMALWMALLPPATLIGLTLSWDAPRECFGRLLRAERDLWPSRLKWERRQFLLERPAALERRLPPSG